MNQSLKNGRFSDSIMTSIIDNLVNSILNHSIQLTFIIDELNTVYHQFMQNMNTNHLYIASINAFIGSTNLVVGHLYSDEVIWDESLTLEFIDSLHDYKNLIQTDDLNFKTQEINNQESLRIYLKNLTTHYQRLLFVRIDLGYLSEFQQTISIENFNEHRTNLLTLISNKQTVFEYLQGYAWAIEQGFDKGFHCHLLLIYDGARRQKAWGIAKKVGEKWQKITNGSGSYFNCHDEQYLKQFRNLGSRGIGMIHRDNPIEVKNAINTALYLTRPDKHNQRMKVLLPNMRTFGKGQYYTSKRRGLPPRK